jgi:nitrogen-specific signal transduction histidine kinase
MNSSNRRAGARPGSIGRAADGRVALSAELTSALERVCAAATSASRAESHDRRAGDLKDVVGEARVALALSASLETWPAAEAGSDAGSASGSLSPTSGISASEWLVRSVAHDLNNMLLVIQSCNEVMRQQPSLVFREASVVQDAVTQATRLVAKLLPADDRIGQPAGIDLSRAVERFTGVIRALVGSDVGVVTQLAPDLPLTGCDEMAIVRVLSNLATNARDAMPDGGTLTLETLEGTFASSGGRAPEPGTFTVLAVSDTGAGMDGPTRARAFEAFFSTKGTGRGTGVGLTAVREIVQAAGGFVEMDSGLGRGTTVRVYLRAVANVD